MTPLAAAIIEAATKGLADQDGALHAARVLREYQEDARAVAVATLVALGGSKPKQGLAPFASVISQQILELTDEIEEAGREGVGATGDRQVCVEVEQGRSLNF
jgi:hypothetical protein